MWQDLFAALALVLVFEGIMPFLKPPAWRNLMIRLVQQPDVVLRVIGLLCMLTGVTLLYFVRG